MQNFFRLLFLISIVFTSLFGHATGVKKSIKTSVKLVGYRVIRASPLDFKSALWMKESNIKGTAKSRLSQFVKIKNKNIYKDFISFQVVPNISLLKEDYELNQLMEFVISSPPTTSHEYRLDITIVNKAVKDFVKGYIDVAPHEQGSLLTFYVEKSTYSDFTLDLLIKTFQLTGVTSKDQQDASAQTLKELK